MIFLNIILSSVWSIFCAVIFSIHWNAVLDEKKMQNSKLYGTLTIHPTCIVAAQLVFQDMLKVKGKYSLLQRERYVQVPNAHHAVLILLNP